LQKKIKKNKKLFAGPFLGEFGWELFCWQGYIRYLSKDYDHTTVVCRSGHHALYRDFADKILEYEPPEYNPNCQYNKGDNGILPSPPDSSYDHIPTNSVHAPSYQAGNGTFDSRYPQIFHQYQNVNKNLNQFNVIIHARSRVDSGGIKTDNRNLSEDNWNIIVSHLKDSGFSVASIGHPSASLHIKETEDLRGISLDDLVSYFCTCKFVMGPSSGPMHLAALCSSDLIVWSGDINNKYRYETAWNPFKNKVSYINGWSNVNLDKIKNLINEYE